MKTLIVLCVSVLATACVTTPVTENVIPIDLVQGQSIHVWSVSAERTPGGTKVVGFAARRQTPNEPVSICTLKQLEPTGKLCSSIRCGGIR